MKRLVCRCSCHTCQHWRKPHLLLAQRGPRRHNRFRHFEKGFKTKIVVCVFNILHENKYQIRKFLTKPITSTFIRLIQNNFCYGFGKVQWKFDKFANYSHVALWKRIVVICGCTMDANKEVGNWLRLGEFYVKVEITKIKRFDWVQTTQYRVIVKIESSTMCSGYFFRCSATKVDFLRKMSTQFLHIFISVLPVILHPIFTGYDFVALFDFDWLNCERNVGLVADFNCL